MLAARRAPVGLPTRPQERFIQACRPKPSFFFAALIAPPDFDVSEPGSLLESTYVLRDTHTFSPRSYMVLLQGRV